eukprot:4649325-Amphidinium_carterae.4
MKLSGPNGSSSGKSFLRLLVQTVSVACAAFSQRETAVCGVVTSHVMSCAACASGMMSMEITKESITGAPAVDVHDRGCVSELLSEQVGLGCELRCNCRPVVRPLPTGACWTPLVEVCPGDASWLRNPLYCAVLAAGVVVAAAAAVGVVAVAFHL